MANKKKKITTDKGGVGPNYNPIVTELVKAHEKHPIVISGYAGQPSDTPNETEEAEKSLGENEADSIRIYSSLEDLSSWHEVKTDSIIHRVTPENPLLPSTFFISHEAQIQHSQPVKHEEQAKFISGSLMARHYSALNPSDGAPPRTLLCNPAGPPPPVMTGPCRGFDQQIIYVVVSGDPAHCQNVMTGPCK